MTVGQAIAGVLALVMPAYDSATVAAAVITAAVLLFTLLLVARSSAPAASPVLARASSVRDRAEQTVFLRLCDPDADGRPRPRAPGR